jgi:hypothetical protein
MTSAKHEDGPTWFPASLGLGALHNVARIGIEFAFPEKFASCGDGDVAGLAEARRSFRKGASHLAHDLLLAQHDRVKAGGYRSQVKQGFVRAELPLRATITDAQGVGFQALATLNDDRGTRVGGGTSPDGFELSSRQRRRLPETGR